MPHLNDLGRPELPFTSMAYGFKTFGLHEWAGRAPMAVWGVAGVVATYGFLARLVDRRAGLYAAVALSTTPLWFVQARTMMGDIVAMSAFAMAFGGLAVAVFDRREEGAVVGLARIAFLLLGILGVVAGFYSRGGVLGVAAPAGGIGLAWALTWASGRRANDLFGDVIGAAALAAGGWFLYRGYQGTSSRSTIREEDRSQKLEEIGLELQGYIGNEREMVGCHQGQAAGVEEGVTRLEAVFQIDVVQMQERE